MVDSHRGGGGGGGEGGGEGGAGGREGGGGGGGGVGGEGGGGGGGEYILGQYLKSPHLAQLVGEAWHQLSGSKGEPND